MAWNGSTNTNVTHPKREGTRKKTPYVGVVGACFFVGLAVLIYQFTAQKEKTQIADEEDIRSRAIATNNPSKARATVEKPKKYSEMTRDEKLAYYRNKYGNNLPENLKPIVYYLENPPQREFKIPSRPEGIFRHHSERTIAAFLMVEPGTWMMRPVEFGAKFDADLAMALTEKIEFNDNDTDEQRELKQAVIDTKRELAERIKNGEKASEILTGVSKQLYELGQYRSNLESQIGSIRRDASMSDQDVKDAVTAANKMLEAKGLPPLKMPNMLIRHASLKVAARKAAEKNEKEK